MSNAYCTLTGVWLLARPKVKYYGAYLSGFLPRARDVLAVGDEEPLLHVCGGRARDYSRPEHGVCKGTAVRGFGPRDRTLDLDPALAPDFLQDAREPWPVLPADHCHDKHYPLWPGILIDRPYTLEDADHYAPGREMFPDLGVLLGRAAAVLAPGRRVGVIDYLFPRPPTGLRLVACYGVVAGFGNRMRCFSAFERAARPARDADGHGSRGDRNE